MQDREALRGPDRCPAANVMNPRLEVLLSAKVGSRVSLGYPGDRCETGLEAIEQIEIIAAEVSSAR